MNRPQSILLVTSKALSHLEACDVRRMWKMVKVALKATPPPTPYRPALLKISSDRRPPRHGWAAGQYMNKCHSCEQPFIGDKRAVQCADCAYKDAPNSKPTPRRKSK